MADSHFSALANIHGHSASYSVNANDGSVLSTTISSASDASHIARTAYNLVTDAAQLGQIMGLDPLKSVTVTFPQDYHTLTVSDDKIYGLVRGTDCD